MSKDAHQPKSKPIERFKELFIYCDEPVARDFFAAIIEHVKKNSTGRWTIDDHGMSMLRNARFEDGLFCCVILQDTNGEPYADVTIKYDQEDHRIWLCNIVPCKVHELTKAQYNNALDRFYSDIVEPCIGNLTCHVTSDSFGGADVMSTGTWKKLEAFSDYANRNSLHPLDNQRWHRFVISAFRNDSKLDASIIGDILQLELGWDGETTRKLMIRYEDEIALLREFCDMPL